MSEPQAAVVTETVSTPTHDGGDLNARVAKVLGDLNGGAHVDALSGTTEEAAETEAPAKTRGTDGKFQKKNGAAQEAPVVDLGAERQAKLARVQMLEQEHYAKATKLTARERATAEQERSLKEREDRLTALERSFGDADSLLGLLEERVGAEKLSQWLLDQANPQKRAEVISKKAASEVEKKLEKLQEELKAREERLEAERREMLEQRAYEEASAELTGRVKEVSEEAPLVARFFDKRPQAALRMADQVARSFNGSEFNFDDVIIRMQAALASDAEIFGAQQSANGSNPSTDRASAQSAAAKAKNTVSNRDAAERSSIVLPDDEADLSLDERTQRAIERRRLRSVR